MINLKVTTMIDFDDIEQDFTKYYIVPCSDLHIKEPSSDLSQIKNKVLNIPENNFLDKISRYIESVKIGRKKRLIDLWNLIHIEHQRMNYNAYHYISGLGESNEKWLKIGENYGFNSLEYPINDESYLRNALDDLKKLHETPGQREENPDLYWLVVTNLDAKLYLYKILDDLFWNIKDHLFEIKHLFYPAIEEIGQSQEEPLNLHEIALFYVYEGKGPITRNNSKQIALQESKGKYKSERLYQYYNEYSQTEKRTLCDSLRKTENKINYIERIIPLLSTKAKNKANDELLVLKTNKEKYL